jgi:hypothetical protein
MDHIVVVSHANLDARLLSLPKLQVDYSKDSSSGYNKLSIGKFTGEDIAYGQATPT